MVEPNMHVLQKAVSSHLSYHKFTCQWLKQSSNTINLYLILTYIIFLTFLLIHWQLNNALIKCLHTFAMINISLEHKILFNYNYQYDDHVNVKALTTTVNLEINAIVN